MLHSAEAEEDWVWKRLDPFSVYFGQLYLSHVFPSVYVLFEFLGSPLALHPLEAAANFVAFLAGTPYQQSLEPVQPFIYTIGFH